MERKTIWTLAAAVSGLFLLLQSAFIVDQTESALLIQLGRPVSRTLGPGLHFKLPLIQNVVFFDARLLDYDAKAAEILTEDKKTMVVDNYAKWRITDPLKFYVSLQTQARAQARLQDIIYAEVRVVLGRYTLIEVVSKERQQIMDQVTAKCRDLLAPFGIEVVDVRIKRTDLPQENERAIFGRMRTERERMAKQYRSEGMEESAKIKAEADKQKTVILAEAERKAEIMRGEGEAQAIKVYADSLNRNPDFYAFQRSLDAYRKSFRDNTRLVLTPTSPFLKFMQ